MDVIKSPDLIIIEQDQAKGYLKACLSDPKYKSNPLRIIAGWDEGREDGDIVEHVSASLIDRRPTIDEMYRVIDIFWEKGISLTMHVSPDSKCTPGIHRHPYCVHLFHEEERHPQVNPRFNYFKVHEPITEEQAKELERLDSQFERDEALLTLDRDKIMPFLEKSEMTPLNEDEMWVVVYTMRLMVPYFTDEVKEVSRQWMRDHGHEWLIDEASGFSAEYSDEETENM